jgi:hypothetical protein
MGRARTIALATFRALLSLISIPMLTRHADFHAYRIRVANDWPDSEHKRAVLSSAWAALIRFDVALAGKLLLALAINGVQ